MREIFSHFEVNNEPRWAILSKLLAASVIFHAAAVASVLYVPSVRDSLNIAALLSRTTYVDRDYKKTDIGDDVQVVEVAKFRYPDGYFATETQTPPTDPALAAAAAAAAAGSGFSFSLPSVKEEPSPSPTPEPSPSASTTGATGTVASANANASATEPVDKADVNKQLDKIAAENDVVRPSENEVNVRPLKDWLARANLLRQQGKLELTSNIEITIAAKLGTDCKLSEANVIQKAGDERLLEVAKDLVSAIGDSGMLSFLRDPAKVQDITKLECDAMPLQLTIKLDQKEITATVQSEADSPARAEKMATGYSGLLSVGQLLKRGKDEEMLYKSTKVTSEGKNVFVNFSMPRQTAGELIKKQLPPAS
jgi:hypothetical protein